MKTTMMTLKIFALLAAAPGVIDAQTLPPYSATTFDFSAFVGKIRIEPGSGKTINLQLKRGNITRLKTTLHQGVLHVSYAPIVELGDAIHYNGNIMQISSGINVKQELIIGNKNYSNSKPQPMAELTAIVPAETSLLSQGFVGEASIEMMKGPADLSVSEGSIKAKRLGPARLRIKGAGDIELGEAIGEVRLSIDGAGDINVKGGNVERAWATVNGAGNIHYTGGNIQQAYVSARGASTIKMDGVVNVTKGVIEGASEVEINSSQY